MSRSLIKRSARVSSDDRTQVVVMVDSIARPGGGERLAIENAIRLDPARYRRTLCITRWDDSFERTEPAASMLARLRAEDVRVIKLVRRSRLALWAWLPLLRALRKERVDVLHGHLFGSNVWTAILGQLARTPVTVAHEHMWAYGGSRLRPFLDRDLIARFCDAFVAVSAEGRQRMIEAERIDPAEIVVIPNGIAGFEPGEGARIRAELGIAVDAKVVGSVGHLRREKAYPVLVEAIAIVRRSFPDVVALVAGEGPEREALEALVESSELEGTVRLIGAREDIPDFLSALDVAVCCSDFEGGPLSVMEYMEAGLPVVATRVGGLPELVRDGESGLLAPPRDPGALASAILRLLGDAEIRSSLGARGRDLRRQHWSLEAWIATIERLYTDLLAGRPFEDDSQAPAGQS